MNQTIKQTELLLEELKKELASTRKLLAIVPFEKADWKPHEKSMTLGRLATHVAEIPNWLAVTLTTSELDFSKGYNQNKPSNNTELMKLFEDCSAKAMEVMKNTREEELYENWTMRNGDHIYFTRMKALVLRDFVFSHLAHHRAQLGVYLRLLDIPIPGIYGPSADDKGM